MIEMLIAIGLGVVSIALITAFGLQLMGEVQDDMVTCPTGYSVNGSTYANCYNVSNSSDTTSIVASTSYNATGDGITALAKIPGKLGIIVLAFIIVVVISVIKLIRG